jgi:hypothetical protein
MAVDLRGALPLMFGVAGIGFGIATLLARGPERVDPPRLAGPPPARFERLPERGLDEETVRRVVREELDHAQKGRPESATSAPAEEVRNAPPPTDEQVKATERARQTVDASIRSGLWSDRDRDELRSALRDSPGDLRLEVTDPLIIAINQGKVRVDFVGPPF